MSIALIINSLPETDPEGYIPVSTEDAFEKKWLPGCEALKLRWVPLFQGGLDINRESIPEILDELSRLRSWMADNFEKDDASFFHGRLDRLAEKLRQVKGDPALNAWIG